MSQNFEAMTMEEYFTYKANSVEDAIINHCDEVCKLIMAQYEEARSKELGAFEQTTSSTNASIMVSLQVLSGPHKGRIFVIRPKSKTYPILGRTTREDVQNYGISLSRDEQVSSYHGLFFIRAGKLKYKDTHSTNHSFINGQLVEEEMTVEEGDILRVGQSELKISIKKIPNA